jgi:hypothetical protein
MEHPEPEGVREDAEQSSAELALIAFPTTKTRIVTVEPAPRLRAWMDATAGWAYRCLPLIVANESGWILRNPVGFTAVWSGEPSPDALSIAFDEEVPAPHPVQSHFGHGVLTWGVPYLFRTPPGYNLLARGPANWPRDAVSALEGLVETDWSIATFTMNWKLTRAQTEVRFERGDPFCMIVPQRRGELERFVPEVRELSSEPAVAEEAEHWSRRRHRSLVTQFLARYSKEFQAEASVAELDYFRGQTSGGRSTREHQKRINLRGFRGGDDPR